MSKPEKQQTIYFTDAEDECIYSEENLFEDDELRISGAAVVYCIACGCILAILALAFCIIYFH